MNKLSSSFVLHIYHITLIVVVTFNTCGLWTHWWFEKAIREQKLAQSLHKICQNTGFLWPIFFRIMTESSIPSLYGKNTGQRKPLFWHILRGEYPWRLYRMHLNGMGFISMVWVLWVLYGDWYLLIPFKLFCFTDFLIAFFLPFSISHFALYILADFN